MATGTSLLIQCRSFNLSQTEWLELGIPLTTGSEEACKMYDAVVTQMFTFKNDETLGGFEGTFNRIKQADPNFVMGHVMANYLEMNGKDGLPSDIAKMKSLAETTPGITTREKKHVHAVDLWFQGYMDKAAAVWEDILVDHPYDVSAISMAFHSYLFRGKSYQIRDVTSRILPHWKPSTPLYGCILSRHAFGLEETNLYAQAEKEAREALSIEPRDAWATHTLCHVFDKVGRHEELINVMEKTQTNWEYGTNLACHNFWHWALGAIELGEYETALSIFDSQLTKRLAASESVFNLSDVTSLLYRLEFEGAAIGDRWRSVSDMYKKHIHDHFSIFYDIHTYMACLNSDEDGLADKMMESIQEFIRNGKGDNREITAQVGEKVMKAFEAYQEGDYAMAVDLIYPVKYRLHELGGSHAQRDVFNLFMIQAAIRSPNKAHHKLARNLLNERKAVADQTPMVDRLMAKVLDFHDD